MKAPQKVAIVTGASEGVGKNVALQLALKDFTVILACKNKGKADRVRKKIIRRSKNKSITFIYLDLENMQIIKEFCIEVLSKYHTVDVLVNYDEVFNSKTIVTSTGLDEHFAFNYLGHFYMTQLLLPALKKSTDSIIISITSSLHSFFTGGILRLLDEVFLEDDDMEKCNLFRERSVDFTIPFFEYGKSKLSLVLFMAELSRRLREENCFNVSCISLDPGFVNINSDTSLKNTWYGFVRNIFFTLFGVSVESATSSIIDCVYNCNITNSSGWYFSGKYGKYNYYKSEYYQKYGKLLWELSSLLCK